ncbi:flavodoxin [Candidatus Izimaplasma bacterium HR1]|jgi:menaquinone-dependent protoporphyrinogen oxidase|uniref:flavodoxin domain-containing protein n=1 Tax=Candidatus Izimoplasma sp. HR1 TaxID=1541959 RepID=UPI0004F85339|nr:flavodoxin [Candidatus Izimaplasma bacterium HR1]
MNSIILYHSKTGCTEKCANYIKEKNDTDIEKIIKFRGSLDDYETIVIMCPIYMGKIEKTGKEFIQKFTNELINKRLIIVLCGMNTKGFKAMVEHNLSEKIREHAEIVYGGGAYYLERMSFMQKRIVQSVARVIKSSEHINYENLDKIKI